MVCLSLAPPKPLQIKQPPSKELKKMDTGIEHVLATFSFTNGIKTKMKYRIQLNDKDISVLGEGEDVKKTKKVLYSDVIGVQLGVEVPKTVPQNADGAAKQPSLLNFITIYSYPPIKSLFGSKYTRRRLCMTFGLNLLESPERNKEALLEIKEKIESKMKEQSFSDAEDQSRFSKPVLFIINPASGKGMGRRWFKEKVVPMLQEAYIEFESIETERPKHGTEIAINLDLSKYYGIVIVSGDGLLYEVFQGLMARTDSVEAIKTPIGILPAGSGNALCCSINYSAGEPFLHDMLIHSTFLLLKHTVRPMDMVKIDTLTGQIWSFLSVTWGLIADIDIESERFRNLGNARFTVEAITRIISPRTYRGKLSFLPVNPYISKGRSKTDVDLITEQPLPRDDRSRANSMPPTHNVTDLSSPVTSDNNHQDNHHIPAASEDNNIDSYHSFEMPDIAGPVPDNWVTIEDNFMSIIVSYQSHLGPELMASPNATMLDGLIYILIMRAPMTRMTMLNLMGQLETGAHVKNPAVELVAVKAFRLEPAGETGNMVVDGEKVPYGPIQGHVYPGLARIMTK